MGKKRKKPKVELVRLVPKHDISFCDGGRSIEIRLETETLRIRLPKSWRGKDPDLWQGWGPGLGHGTVTFEMFDYGECDPEDVKIQQEEQPLPKQWVACPEVPATVVTNVDDTRVTYNGEDYVGSPSCAGIVNKYVKKATFHPGTPGDPRKPPHLDNETVWVST